MDSSQYEQKPIQLVYVTPEGKYEMHPAAESFLRSIPKPLAVISVAGLYRTGKSYLLNRILLNRNNGFGVGPTINPCTKGLWCWGVPLKGTTADGQKINILIVDSEGIGALDEDQNHDIKIFTLAILTSSIFIYNSVGSIDQTALQNLSLVVNLTKNIALNTQNNDEEDPQELARYFPTFFWVVRDFSLQLISSEGESLTPKDYLERALAPQKGFSDDVEEKNRIRRLLTSFFKDRECATLVRPLVNEQKLQHLYDCSFDDLRPQFVEQALNLRKKVLTNAKPKMFKGEYLDGQMYVSMINSYLAAINNGGVPNIQNAWTYMCIEKCMKLQEICYDFFVEETEKAFRDNLPCSINEFEGEIENIQNECYKIFESEQIGDESKSYLQELKAKIKEKINILRIENERQSINILKNYIIKNFSVIEKKVKANQFQSFQEYLKSINSFYGYLVENGPDLPKRQIVYLDFLKKVTTQGAEIFIKQINLNLQSLKQISSEKEKLFKKENEELKNKIKADLEKYKERMDSILNEKQEIEKKAREFGEKYEQIQINSRAQISKLQTSYEHKLKVVEVKLAQTSLNLEEMKQKKQTLQTSYILQKKEREKQKALMQLKMNQLKDQLKAVKARQKNQQVYINELNLQTNIKLKQSTFQYEKKINELTGQLHQLKESFNQTMENKEDLQSKLKILEKNAAQTSKKLQDDLKTQIEKFQAYKNEVEAQKSDQIKSLQNQYEALQANFTEMTSIKDKYYQQAREFGQKLKSITCESQKEIAILTQKIEFLNDQASENKERLKKNIERYETMLANHNEMKQEQLRQTYKTQFNKMEEQSNAKIGQLEAQVSSLKDKCTQQSNTIKKMEDSHKFNAELDSKRYQNEIKNQLMIIENLEQQKRKLYNEKDELLKEMEEKIANKECYYQDRLNILEKELQIAVERASEQQSELSNKSEESLKQLKNYYELQKENLEHRISNDREKNQKKITKMRQQYENQIEQERKVTQQEFQNLKDEFNNEVTMLKELVINLQHENDSKSKTLENTEIRYEQLKERLEKKELQLSNKIQSLLKTNSQEKQGFQQKLIESSEQKSKLEKEIIVINHQKDQVSKEMKDLTTKYESKIQEIFQLNKSMDKVNNESRQRLNELNNEYMNERLNYEKKIALGEQEKQFYCKKIEEYEKQQIKSASTLEQLNKKLKNDYQEEIKSFEQKKNAEYATLQSKYQKLKKGSKQNEQQMTRNINELQKQLALQQQKNSNLLQKYEQLEEKRSNDGTYLSSELSNVKQQLTKANKQFTEEVAKLKKELNQAINERNQIQVLYQRDKILLENKNNFLEETKEKQKKEFQQARKNLEQKMESMQKTRMNDKNFYEASHNENISKLQRKYNCVIQQNHQNWQKKERQYQTTIKQMQFDLRSSNEKMGNEVQMLSQNIKTQERRIRELQENEKRAMNELQKYRAYKQTSSSQNLSMYQRQRENMKQKIQQKQEKCKNLQKVKQQIYYNFEKQKARWNLQKENYLMKHDELKEVISKQEKDMEKLSRENQKLKAEKKCSKMSGLSGFSRYSLERANTKYSLQDSINSINMSTSKQNCNPLGELSFFNNQ